MAVFDLALALHRCTFTDRLVEHFAGLAQRDPAAHCEVLSHMLGSDFYGTNGELQLRLLKQGHHTAWNGQGPQLLLLNVVIELRDVIAPFRLPHVRGRGVRALVLAGGGVAEP
jgi:hypothetical protein